jgi:hypothetical protein
LAQNKLLKNFAPINPHKAASVEGKRDKDMTAAELIKDLQELPPGQVITAETADGRGFRLLNMVLDADCDLSMIRLEEI